jgi:DNA-binding MarR family transcriptional regulator/GNAT superfamily N-acetyltransferase
MVDPVAEIRSFNRFYTRFVGALDEGHLGSAFSLAEVRVLYEAARQDELALGALAARMSLDPGYLTRIVDRLEARGLVERRRSTRDRRSSSVALTAAGRRTFAELDSKAAVEVERALRGLPESEVERLIAATHIVRRLVGGEGGTAPQGNVQLRAPRAGDYGWAIARHGRLYADEYGWDERFEGLVAELFGRFARAHDPARERCWIAELDGEPAGCLFLVARDEEVAQLRCLLVEPGARGRGIGRLLVEACLGFAREAGYRRMMLWTNDVLVSARRIYEAAGFRLTSEERHKDFGPELVGQSWEVEL